MIDSRNEKYPESELSKEIIALINKANALFSNNLDGKLENFHLKEKNFMLDYLEAIR